MFQCSRHGAVDVISGTGPLSHEQVPVATEAFEACLQRGHPKAVLDLQQIVLLDGAALEMLLDLQEDFERRGGSLKLAAAGPLCRDILHVTGVRSRFATFDDVKAAVRSFAQ